MTFLLASFELQIWVTDTSAERGLQDILHASPAFISPINTQHMSFLTFVYQPYSESQPLISVRDERARADRQSSLTLQCCLMIKPRGLVMSDRDRIWANITLEEVLTH